MNAKPFGTLPVSRSWLRWGGSALLLAAAVLLLPKKELAAAFGQMRWERQRRRWQYSS